MPIREKKIYSGDILEVELYEISLRDRASSRAKKTKLSSPAQRNLNNKNARKHLTRLINTNFGPEDIHLTLTYREEMLPQTEAEVNRDISNFFRRIRSRRKRQGLPDLRYIAVVEYAGTDGRSERVHHHIIMSGDMPRDEVERIWQKGRCNSSRLQPDERGLEGLAKYLTKERKSGKRWKQSKNLKQPTVKVNDWRFSRYKAARLIPGDCADLYPGYVLSDYIKTSNDVTGGTMITILMRRTTADEKRRADGKSQTRACPQLGNQSSCRRDRSAGGRRC